MYERYNKKFDFYKFENLLDFSDKISENVNKLIEILKNTEIEEFCDILKIIPLVTDLNSQSFNNSKKKKIFSKINDYIIENLKATDIEYWNNYKRKVVYLNELIEEFYEFRKKYFYENETNLPLDGELLVVAAEVTMNNLANLFNPNVIVLNGKDNLENRNNIYEGYINYVSNVMKYFLYRKTQFKLNHKIYSQNDVEITSKHFGLNEHWDELMDIIEYFRFSDIEIEKENKKFKVEITDKIFDRSVLISNFREQNFVASLNDSIVHEIKKQNLEFKSFGKKSEFLAKEHCKRIFGIENLCKTIDGISIEKWLSAYFFIKEQAVKRLNNRKDILKIEELCVVKSFYWWRRQLIKYNKSITKKEADRIIKAFIFEKESKDLIDNPLIKFDDYLVLIPSITFDLAADKALISLFINKKFQINFKGLVFEKRLQNKLKKNNILAESISAHVNLEKNKNNYETDLVFILDETMFVVECKSIIPPYTIKDHAKTNAKIIDEIQKFKNNATFFENNVSFVKQKLRLSGEIKINEVIKVFVTSSTLGMAGIFDDINIIDEAALNSFLLRNPPVIRDTDMNIHYKMNCWEFEGEITAEKMKSFLQNPPSFKMMEKGLSRVEHKLDKLNITRYRNEVPRILEPRNQFDLSKKDGIDLFKTILSNY